MALVICSFSDRCFFLSLDFVFQILTHFLEVLLPICICGPFCLEVYRARVVSSSSFPKTPTVQKGHSRSRVLQLNMEGGNTPIQEASPTVLAEEVPVMAAERLRAAGDVPRVERQLPEGPLGDDFGGRNEDSSDEPAAHRGPRVAEEQAETEVPSIYGEASASPQSRGRPLATEPIHGPRVRAREQRQLAQAPHPFMIGQCGVHPGSGPTAVDPSGNVGSPSSVGQFPAGCGVFAPNPAFVGSGFPGAPGGYAGTPSPGPAVHQGFREPESSAERHSIASSGVQHRARSDMRLNALENSIAQLSHALHVITGSVRMEVMQYIDQQVVSVRAQIEREEADRVEAVANLDDHVTSEFKRVGGSGGPGGAGSQLREKQPMVSRRGFDTLERLDGEVAGYSDWVFKLKAFVRMETGFEDYVVHIEDQRDPPDLKLLQAFQARTGHPVEWFDEQLYMILVNRSVPESKALSVTRNSIDHAGFCGAISWHRIAQECKGSKGNFGWNP